MPTARARLLVAPSLLAALTLAPLARADAPAAPLARVLAAPGLPHALADRSGRIPITVPLRKGQDARALGLLQVAPGIGAARFDPATLQDFANSHPDVPLHFAPPLRPLLDISTKAWTHAQDFRSATGLDGSGVLIGVIDTGLDISHPDFRDKNGKTRVAWFLNAEPPRGLHPDLEDQFGCTDPKQTPCAVYDAADIDLLISQGAKNIHDAEGHGTHVTSIAAGNGGPMLFPNPVYAGVAPGATLIVASPSSGEGFYDSDVLNAARFVFDRADQMGLPIALNLSVGGDFGPHDGTSSLEKGLSAFVGDDKPGHAIVVAAGNSGALARFGDGRGPIGAHTEARVSPGSTVSIPLVAGEAKKGGAFVWINFRPGDDVSVALDGPGGESWIGFVDKGHEAGYKTDDASAGIVNNLVTKDSSLTADTNGAVIVWSGAWPDNSEFTVKLRGAGEAELWVTGSGDSNGPFGMAFDRAVKQGTITVPASAPSLLAVGCTINRLSWKPLGSVPIELTSIADDMSPEADSACYFSSFGPTPDGLLKPEISAPGGFVIGAMSAEADPRVAKGGLFDPAGCPDEGPCYVVDDYHAVTAGTSMSAPHVTGAVALLFELGTMIPTCDPMGPPVSCCHPPLTQARVTEILQAGARRPIGKIPYPSQLGPGELDLEGARQVFCDQQSAAMEPDLTKSWYTLSSTYARADPTWPIWGTVELRRADGKIASGLDGTNLELSVKNGVVIKPLTKVRHGMWRFAVAGQSRLVGEEMTVDVTYGGTSLGAQVLPIGTDVWTTDGKVNVVGGCAFGGGEAKGALALLALSLAAAWSRRRRP